MADRHEHIFRARTEVPLSTSFRDVVAALAAKLEDTARSDAREERAIAAGKADIASLFARIAARDRHSIDELMQSLSAHQPEERVAPPTPAPDARERRHPPRFRRE